MLNDQAEKLFVLPHLFLRVLSESISEQCGHSKGRADTTNRGFEETPVVPFPLKTHLEGAPWSAEYVLKRVTLFVRELRKQKTEQNQ